VRLFALGQTAIGKVIGPGGATIRALIEEFSLLNIDIAEDGAEVPPPPQQPTAAPACARGSVTGARRACHTGQTRGW